MEQAKVFCAECDELQEPRKWWVADEGDLFTDCCGSTFPAYTVSRYLDGRDLIAQRAALAEAHGIDLPWFLTGLKAHLGIHIIRFCTTVQHNNDP